MFFNAQCYFGAVKPCVCVSFACIKKILRVFRYKSDKCIGKTGLW